MRLSIGWVLIAPTLAIFIILNWGEPQTLVIWPALDGDHFLLRWPIGLIAGASFLLGLVPIWFVHRSLKWKLQRRIKHLEKAIRSNLSSSGGDLKTGQSPTETTNTKDQKSPRSKHE